MWLGCRSAERAQAALHSMAATLGRADRLAILPMDLASLDSVAQAAGQFLSLGQPLDLLVNNAGIMGLPLQRTAAGHEMLFAVNHLAHFALTGLLLPALEAAPAARVVTVSSLAARRGELNIDDLNWERQPYSKVAAYGRAKLANLCFAAELQRRLSLVGSPVCSLAAHPGYAATNVGLSDGGGKAGFGRRFWQQLVRIGNWLLAQSAERGALPSVYAATAGTLRGGEYIGPSGPFEFRGGPTRIAMLRAAEDITLGGQLWHRSEQLTGVSYL